MIQVERRWRACYRAVRMGDSPPEELPPGDDRHCANGDPDFGERCGGSQPVMPMLMNRSFSQLLVSGSLVLEGMLLNFNLGRFLLV